MTRGSRLPAMVAVAFLVAGLWPAAARAQVCSFSTTSLAFGQVDLLASTPADVSGSFDATCTGAAGQTVRICPHFGAGSGGAGNGGATRTMSSGSDTLAFNIYRGPGFSEIWGSNLWAYAASYPVPELTLTIGAGGSGTLSVPVLGRIPGGQQTRRPGTYTSVFSGGDATVGYANASLGSCAAIGVSNAQALSFTVSATYAPACRVSSGTLNFGNIASLASAVTSSASIDVQCSAGTAYTVGLGNGSAGGSDPTQRTMRKGAEILRYGLYQNAARSLPWGDVAPTSTVAGTGDGLSRPVTVYGQVDGGQPVPSPGTYSDNVVITVTY